MTLCAIWILWRESPSPGPEEFKISGPHKEGLFTPEKRSYEAGMVRFQWKAIVGCVGTTLSRAEFCGICGKRYGRRYRGGRSERIWPVPRARAAGVPNLHKKQKPGGGGQDRAAWK